MNFCHVYSPNKGTSVMCTHQRRDLCLMTFAKGNKLTGLLVFAFFSCKDIIIKRQIRQSEGRAVALFTLTLTHPKPIVNYIFISDVRLNPQLLNFCALDLPKFCPEPHKGEGKIIACLKKHVDVGTSLHRT